MENSCAGTIGWLRLVGSLKLQVSFAKESYKRGDILQKRPIISRSLLIVATPYWVIPVQAHLRIHFGGFRISQNQPASQSTPWNDDRAGFWEILVKEMVSSHRAQVCSVEMSSFFLSSLKSEPSAQSVLWNDSMYVNGIPKSDFWEFLKWLLRWLVGMSEMTNDIRTDFWELLKWPQSWLVGMSEMTVKLTCGNFWDDYSADFWGFSVGRTEMILELTFEKSWNDYEADLWEFLKWL